MHELAEVDATTDPSERPVGWFLPDHARRVYDDYLRLDEDRNGMLSRPELLKFRGARGDVRLTPAVVDRVFAELPTYRPDEARTAGEVDFKTYLDLVLAFEDLGAPSALALVWRLRGTQKTWCISFMPRGAGAFLNVPSTSG